MGKFLRDLLERLDTIAVLSEEIGDTVVREKMGLAVWDSYIRNHGLNCIPTDFGIYSGEQNEAVHCAIREFVEKAMSLSTIMGLKTFGDRLDCFQDAKVTTSLGRDYEDYFGHTERSWYDADGNLIEAQR